MSDQADIKAAVELLFEQVKSAQLATINQQQQAESSYSPYVIDNQKLYLFISELASHTQNLKHNPQASLLIIEDENQAKNIFARKRLILNCQAQIIPQNNEKWQHVLNGFEQRHGNTIALLKTLPDFILFELNCQNGSYIQGFGQAFRFDHLDYTQAEQVTGK